MTTKQTDFAQHVANIARVADQHADAVLCHYLHLSPRDWTDERYEAEKRQLSSVIAGQLATIVS